MATLLIDGMSIMKSTTFTVANLDKGFLYTFLRATKSVLEKVDARYKKIDAVIVCWDGNPQERKALMPGYKGSRTKSGDKFTEDRTMLQVILPVMGIHQAFSPFREADDLIAHYCSVIPGEKVIFSNDYDMRQLVGPETTLYQNDRSAKKGYVFITPENFSEITGVSTPELFLEYKAIAGDSSDEIPGIRRVGLPFILQFIHNGELPASKAEKIRDFLASPEYERNKKLMNLRNFTLPEVETDNLGFGEAPEFLPDRFTDILLEHGFSSIYGSPKYLDTYLALLAKIGK